MNTEFVRVVCTVDCDWAGLPPIYRVYVNHELFAERTWIWTDSTIEELLQIQAPPGDYNISYELVPPHLATMRVKNMHVEHGKGRFHGLNTLRIGHASQ